MEMPSTYSWKARIAPVILMAVPPVSLALVAAAWLPGATRLWSIVGAAALLLAGEVGRDRGRRREREVWAAWGGAPTTRRLRHRDAENAVLHARRHRQLQHVVGADLPLPNPEQEAADPGAADNIYETATGVLRARTHADRDRFPLVHAELASYGFRRNLVGLKPHAIAVAVCTMLLTGAVGAVLLVLHQRAGLPSLLLPLLVSAAAVVGWWRIGDAWVRPVAEAYADRLLDTVETLGVDTPGGQGTT